MIERRIKVLNTLILYLSTGNFPVGDGFINYSIKTETNEFASQLYYRLVNGMENTGSEYLNSADSEYNLEHASNNWYTRTQNIQNPKNFFETITILEDIFIFRQRS